MSADIGKYYQFSQNDQDKHYHNHHHHQQQQQPNSQSKDEVDFIKTSTNPSVQFNTNSLKLSQQQQSQKNQQQHQTINEKIINTNKFSQNNNNNKDTNYNDTSTISTATTLTTITTTTAIPITNRSTCNNLLTKKFIPGTLYGDCEVKTSIKSSLSTLEKLAIFNINRKRNNNNSNTTDQTASSMTTTTTTTSSTIDTNNTTSISSSLLSNKKSDKHKTFVKSASIARLLGNTYNTKKYENDLKNSTITQNNCNNKNNINCNNGPVNNNNNSNSNNNAIKRPNNNNSDIERFKKYSNMYDDDNNNNNNADGKSSTTTTTTMMMINSGCNLQDFHDDIKDDFSSKAFRTISRSLGKLWWKRTHSIEISAPDPEYKVSYLGNVLTGWAKGEGCIEKPLNTLWRNYTQNHKPDVIMKIKVCASGLKATTRQHGLTEYWAHRITYCCAPKNYPKVFCWIYRHEGRKLKHELRCHAVLCSKESIAQDICKTLRENLDRALRDFKREKISKQNARLSLANAVYENPSLPKRKILLSVGGNNYRPPLERSKSAPKLMAIEEAIGEEDGETEQTNEPEMQSCCAKDSMYPAMTLGRRRCRRGHSIRRTGKGSVSFSSSSSSLLRSSFKSAKQLKNCTSINTKKCTNQLDEYIEEEDEGEEEEKNTKEYCKSDSNLCDDNHMKNDNLMTSNYRTKTKSVSSLGSDEDDLEKFLSYHDYDTNSPLAGELLSYFDMKMHNDDPKTLSLTNLNDENMNYDIYMNSLTTDPNSRPTALSLDNLDSLIRERIADEDENNNHDHDDHEYDEDVEDIEEIEKEFYRRSSILKLLENNQTDLKYNMENDTTSTSCATLINGLMSEYQRMEHKHQHQQQQHQQLQQQQHRIHLDSDEGSISSGCETASTVTANMDDTSLKYNSNSSNERNSICFDESKSNENDSKKNSFTLSDHIPNTDDDDDQNGHDIMTQHQRHQITNESYNEDNEEKHNNDNKINNCCRNKRINFILPNSENHQQQQQQQQKQQQYDQKQNRKNDDDISDSEFSDESGYVEFQEQNILQNRKKSISV